MVGSCETLMEMDQMQLEIRWGNGEKMADVLTGGVALWSWQEEAADSRMFNL